MKSKILAIIPARGGSKGVKRKNIKNLNGKPLIAYTIESSINSSFIDTTIVSSEDKEILQVSKSFGAEIINRPEELASDTASTMPVIIHTINELLSQKREFDIVIILQPTSPLRDSIDIDGAIKSFINKDVDALISVVEPDIEVLKSYIVNKDGYLQGAFDDKYPFTRRQDLPKAYLANGAIYMIKTSLFLKNKSLMLKKTLPFVMPKNKSVNIDTIEDFNRAKDILNKKQKGV